MSDARKIWVVAAAMTAWLCAGAARAAAQAGVEAGMAGAAASSVGTATGKATGNAVGGALGKIGAATTAATAGANSSAGTAGAGSAGKASGGAAAAPSSSSTIHFTPPIEDVGAGGTAVEGPPPDIHFDVVSFQRCNAGEGSDKIDMPMDGDYVAYHCQPVFRIIYFAYEGSAAGTLTLGGYPDWVETELYDFEAKVAPENVAAWQKLSLNQRRVALRALLAKELKLKIHANMASRTVYALSVSPEGPKLKEYTDGEQEKLPNGLVLTGKDMTWVGRIAYFQGMSTTFLADSLSAHLDRQVVDKTGLTGSYDFALQLPYGSNMSANATLGENTPSVAEELGQLGLRLETAKVESDGLVVQHVERPVE